jgi:hypothetical protein
VASHHGAHFTISSKGASIPWDFLRHSLDSPCLFTLTLQLPSPFNSRLPLTALSLTPPLWYLSLRNILSQSQSLFFKTQSLQPYFHLTWSRGHGFCRYAYRLYSRIAIICMIALILRMSSPCRSLILVGRLLYRLRSWCTPRRFGPIIPTPDVTRTFDPGLRLLSAVSS